MNAIAFRAATRPRTGTRPCLPALFAALVLAAALLPGCATITIKPAPVSERYETLDRTALDSDRPSDRTLAFLKQRDLLDQWERDPDGLILGLDAKYHHDPGIGTLFTLMELTHLRARAASASDPERAAALHLSCALYAYLFLFDPKSAPPMSSLRPYGRLASEFYNRSLSNYLLHARSRGLRFSPGRRLDLVAGSLELTERQSGLPFKPEEFSEFHLAYEYAVSGLDVTYALPGLGVPLIVARNAQQDKSARPEERYLSRIRQVLPATLFLRIETDPTVSSTGGGRIYKSRIELYDPMRVDTVHIGDQTAPLESDITTALAYMAANAPPPPGIKGFMDPEALKSAQGLYMLQPYQPDKIPVVFVHGLISSPMTWVPMINGLMGDPELRKRYQFWYFAYPTGNPVFYSASLLRQSLLDARQAFDPGGANPAFNNMLIVGHSMGGLLTKAMVQDSGDRLWNAFSKVPPADLPVTPDVRELLERVFFFKPLPFVTEAVFIATPHRGSEMALGTIGRIGKALVTLPLTVAKASGAFLGALAKTGSQVPMTGMPTGIDGLSPNNKMLTTSADLPLAAPFHTICGNEDKAGEPGGTDGIVPYWSSRLDGARTELIVKSGHGAHEHPLAIREVRRVMLEHAATPGAPAP